MRKGKLRLWLPAKIINKINISASLFHLENIAQQDLNSLIFKGYENLVVEHVGDNGLKIKRLSEHFPIQDNFDALEIPMLSRS